MSSVVVFVFLLDNLAGFNIVLNDTLIENAKYMHNNEIPVIKKCDSYASDQILSAVSHDLDLVIVPSYRNNDNQPYEEIKEQTLETKEVFDDSLSKEMRREIYYDKTLNAFDNDFTSFYKRNLDSTGHAANKVSYELKNETKIRFPNSAPFLVAIFESRGNTTAQTCAGTLLTPRWVLTAANCIDILSDLFINNTNSSQSSHYTIVVGSSNPLVDGSAHNVTTILLHPDSKTLRAADQDAALDGPYLALLRIEPEVEGPTMELMGGVVKSGEVMVYGWMLSKNETDHDTLNRTTIPSQILNPAECQTMYSYKDYNVLCLYTNEMNNNNVAQLSSGGPVLMIHEGKVKVLSVVQTDDQVFVSYPLAAHYDWILHTIHNK